MNVCIVMCFRKNEGQTIYLMFILMIQKHDKSPNSVSHYDAFMTKTCFLIYFTAGVKAKDLELELELVGEAKFFFFKLVEIPILNLIRSYILPVLCMLQLQLDVKSSVFGVLQLAARLSIFVYVSLVVS